MMNHPLEAPLRSAFNGLRVSYPKKNQLVVQLPKEGLLSVLTFLQHRGYRHLQMISCVDWMDEKEFELVYILSAYLEDGGEYTETAQLNILVKIRIDRDAATALSVLPIFENAEPYEREIHELFGIHFEGHPRLTPLFLERSYAIPPFRKDFDSRRYVEDVFEKIPTIEKSTGNS